MLKRMLLLIYLSGALVSVAQVGDAIQNFKAEELQQNVYLTWSIKQGFTCNGVGIYRSTDSLVFVKIGDIEGICGSTQESIAYDFTDNFPEKNTRNHYRLSLGGIGNSHVISIDIIDIPANKYLIVPNPVSDLSELFFENSAVSNCTLRIFKNSGQHVQTQQGNNEIFLLNAADFDAGIYLFRIDYENEKNTIFGRFIVP